MIDSESVYSSDEEETGLKASQIKLKSFLPDILDKDQVSKFEIHTGFRMTRSMEKMFSVCVSSQKSGGAGDPIHPEVSPDRQILRFTASLSPGSKVEVKFRGKEVAGSPFTYHVPPPGPATDDLRRMKLFQDLERAIADAENNVPEPSKKMAPSSPGNPSTTADLSSDSSNPAPAPGFDFSAGINWTEVDFVHSKELDGRPLGLCLLKNGNLVVSTMNDQVKMFDPQLQFIKEIRGKDGQGFRRPGDMTRLYNGDFALKDDSGIQVFSERGDLRSRVRIRENSWCYGLAEDGEKRLWFIDFNRRAKETSLTCIDQGKELQHKSLKEIVGDRIRESKCRFLTFSKGELYVTDLGLNQIYILDPNNFESVRIFGSSGAGDGQFNDPAGVAVDDVGNIVVADSRNNRLCLHDKNGKWIRNIKERQDGVNRPSDILREGRQLFCNNLFGIKAVVKYRAEPASNNL